MVADARTENPGNVLPPPFAERFRFRHSSCVWQWKCRANRVFDKCWTTHACGRFDFTSVSRISGGTKSRPRAPKQTPPRPCKPHSSSRRLARIVELETMLLRQSTDGDVMFLAAREVCRANETARGSRHASRLHVSLGAPVTRSTMTLAWYRATDDCTTPGRAHELIHDGRHPALPPQIDILDRSLRRRRLRRARFLDARRIAMPARRASATAMASSMRTRWPLFEERQAFENLLLRFRSKTFEGRDCAGLAGGLEQRQVR